MPATPFLFDAIILVVEPNATLQTPYIFIPEPRDVRRVSTIERAIQEIIMKPPDMVFLSASFPAEGAVRFLDELKDISIFHIIPIVVVVDLSCRMSTILGTSWGGRIAVVDSRVPRSDFFATIQRVTTLQQ